MLFGKKQSGSIQISESNVRAQLLDSVDASIYELQREKVLEHWLKNTCTETYEAVAADIDQEWENTLSSMEHTLSRIESDLAKNEEEKLRIEKEMESQCGRIQQILTALQPVYQKLEAHLN